MHITDPLPREKHARLVFGLDWRAYPAKQARAERRRYADDFSATRYAEYKAGKESIGGFCSPVLVDMKGAKLFSGAARIALHERVKSKPAVLVLIQDDQRIYAVFVVRGAVRSDEVLSVPQAFTRRAEVEKECERLNLKLTTLGTGGALGDVDESFGAAALLDQRNVGRIAKLPVSVPALVPVVVFVGAVTLGALKVFGAFDSTGNAQHVPTVEEIYAQAVQKAFSGATPRANELGPAILSTLGLEETVRRGWLFEDASCPARGICSLSFRRYGGSFEDFARNAPSSMHPLRFDADGLHAGGRGPAVPKVNAVTVRDSKAWPNEQTFIEMVQTPPQKLSKKTFEIDSYGYQVKIDPSRPLVTIAPGTPGQKPAHMIRMGTWEIHGYRWQAPLLARLPSNMGLDSIDVKLKLKDQAKKNNSDADVQAGIQFIAKGKYYVLD
ncbi:hypothetical protein LJR267_009526 [Paraburkholderia hospita]|uniref:hypothetical protein n=1 Tax=Paraburkholderia hospita TaxID=169430 RepID=UPI003ECE2DC4